MKLLTSVVFVCAVSIAASASDELSGFGDDSGKAAGDERVVCTDTIMQGIVRQAMRDHANDPSGLATAVWNKVVNNHGGNWLVNAIRLRNGSTWSYFAHNDVLQSTSNCIFINDQWYIAIEKIQTVL